MSKRLTKQEIREDRVLVVATQGAEFIKRNSRVVMAGAAVIVVTMVVAVLLAQGRVRAEKDAAAGMTQAQTVYFNGDFAQAAAQFQSIVDRFGSSKAAVSARLFLGNAQLAGGNASAAEQSYRKFLGSRGLDGILQSAGQRGVGASLYSQQKFAEAAAAYEKSAQLKGNLMAGEDWFHAGRAYDSAGQKTDAVRAYRQVLDNYPQSQVAQEARIRLQESLARQ